MAPAETKALLFDVFGTTVDWRGGIIRAGRELEQRRGSPAPEGVDWAALADAWRAEYRPSMERVMRGELPWTNLDGLHRASLEGLLPRFGLAGLGAEEREFLVGAWHRLDPWPDVLEGLRRLRRRYIVAPLSNGNVALLTNMARRAGLPWDLILSAEWVRRYKPDPATYLLLPRLFSFDPKQVMMVAAHPDDLLGARRAGLRTAFVPRPLEFGPEGTAPPPEGPFDVVAGDFVDLAERLGAPAASG
ncbi:haloacid dehalogenase, type II [Rubrobacter xylanophilus DSM 9941]|uniref:Haloacid dehalogenase, type II n=1 Tax=Rubrobacter xylanophilus (strain DSM 9941 / JCM 11954 / NBRC 16129 / PRD-1) TaxID=266117 RepID=Q1AYP6_RUBXD|nr:haloacid dehalogenase type II [Rubrobacter xylanophilus]ABG03482.1 haloacid dehalogenase, type II [Rubrobacter xylanophilus DSM 9941]